MTGRDIIRAEYGRSRNLMTPDRLRVGKLGRDSAYELSSGRGLYGDPLYGVSVVRVLDDGRTERDYQASACFSTLDDATAYIERLRGEGTR